MAKTKVYTEEEQMKLLGIALGEPAMVESYYQKLRGVLVTGIGSNPNHGLILDLDNLPNDPFPFKTIFLKWLIHVNMPRLKQGLEPITDLSVVLKCPIWKVIKPPFKSIGMSKEGMFNKPSLLTLGKMSKPGAINKGKK